MQGQDIFAAMFRVRGFQGDGRHASGKVERCRSQAGEFTGSQSGHRGHAVQHRPRCPIQPPECYLAFPGLSNQPGQFVG